jgi:UDP-N-acetylmuramoyl-L-alanyl-D-glutamate--2,6-diaminopimelate ligase
VVGSNPPDSYSDLEIPYLKVDDTRAALARLAAAWYGYPARDLVVLGVTGTDGKTTTANLVYKILINAGFKAGMVSTVNAVIGDQILDTGFHVTTPEAMDIQKYLAEMVTAGITHVVLETTSHGLVQKRVASCEYDIGLMTNITHEHLDYHGDYQGYLEAKAELFDLVAGSTQKTSQVNKIAVINADDESFPFLQEKVQTLGLETVEYAVDLEADFTASGIDTLRSGLSFDLINGDQKIPIQTSLLGLYNVSNCLAAAAACRVGLDISWENIQRGILSLDGIPGRINRLDTELTGKFRSEPGPLE